MQIGKLIAGATWNSEQGLPVKRLLFSTANSIPVGLCVGVLVPSGIATA